MNDSRSPQPGLFDGFAETPTSAYQPDPARVRARLERIVGEARAADVLPWETTRVSLYRFVVPDLARWLPRAEGAGWTSAFETEMTRLGHPAT